MKVLPATRAPRVDAWRSVRRFCLECQGESAPAVLACADRQCALRPWRLSEPPAEALAACMAGLKLVHMATAHRSGDASGDAFGDALDDALGGNLEGKVSEAKGESSPPRDPRIRKALSRCALRAIRRHCLNCAGDRREVRACAAREECGLWSLRFGVRPETYKAVRQRFAAPKKLSLL